jgi:tetratricopeptide (TPR) repeat protein
MAALTVSNYLGMLQADPYDQEALAGLRDALESGDPGRLGESPLRLLEMARVGHERRSELSAAAALIDVETLLVADDPDFRAALFKELGRLRHEELLDDAGAKTAYQSCLELRPGDFEVEEIVEQIDQAAASWRQIADRFIEEAQGASDATLKTSLLCRAASLVWQYKKKGKQKETDQLFQQALEADPGNVRAARLYAITLRARESFAEAARVIAAAGSECRSRDEKINCWIEAGRLYVKNVGDKDAAAECYQQVLDFAPTHEEALSFLVGYFTEREDWDYLVALYEDALRSRRKLESEQGILLQLGMVHWRIRQEPDKAEPYFARIRKSEPAHPGMLAFYREHYANDPEGRLLTVLADAQRVLTDPEEKLAVAVELAHAAQAANHIERAIDAWKAVQRQRPDNPDASGALRVLYRRGEKWNALVEVLRAELDKLAPTEREARLDVLRELVPIYRDHLGLDAMVVNTYGQILELAPDDAEALAQLAVTYEQMGRWNDLIQVLTKQAQAEVDPAAKVATYMRVADLWVSRFANYNQATKPLESVIELDPQNREALAQLKEIYGKKRAWKNLYEVLLRETELVDDHDELLARYVELAKLAGERLHKHADAIGLWKKVLERAPESEEALEALEKLAEREKDWATLADVLERRAEPDGPNRIKLLQKLGAVYGEQLGEPAKAASAWKRVLELEPKNGRAMRTLRESFLAAKDWEGLEGLYAEAQDWEGLVEVLGTAAERTGDAALKVELSFRAAAVYAERIGEPHRAFRNYERVLSVDPKNEAAARALLPIYERDEKWPRVVSVLEVLFEVTPAEQTGARLELARRLAGLCLERVNDAQGAFRWAGHAYELAPTDADVQADLERAAEVAGAYEALAALYLARIDAASPDEQLGLRRKVASIAGERLGKRDESIEQLRQILETNPKDDEAIAVLDRLYRAENRTVDLRALYAHRLAHAEDDLDRHALLMELGPLEEDVLDEPESAAQRYRDALAIEPTDGAALVALDRLAERGRRWDELADVLARRVELTDDAAARAALLLRLGDVALDRRADVSGAITAYGRVLEAEGSNAAAVQGLERIADEHPERAVDVGRILEGAYERRGAYEKLAKVLDARLGATRDEDEKRALRLRLAELASTALGDPAGAYASLEAAFLDHPTDATLWDRLSGAAEAAGKQTELVQAFATAIEAGGLADADAADLARRVAEIYDIALDRPAEAEPFHRRVLQHDPLSDRAFIALKELYTNSERWDDLQALYRNRIAETVDADAKLELLLQVCFLFEELLDDPGLAIKSYQEVLELSPEHAGSRRALERLYRRAERWRDLAELLRQELVVAQGQEATERTFELGQLYESKLEEPALAVDFYEQVLEQSPTHLRAQEALERLVSEATQRQRIAAILEPLYETQGAWSDLTRILEIQLEAVGDPSSKVGTLMRIAAIYEDNLHDPDKAFGAVARATAADPADPAIREQLKKLAAIRDAQSERAAVLDQVIEAAAAAGSTYLQSELLLELATLWYEEEGDFEKAERVYTRLIEVDADNPDVVLPASQALERIHLEKDDHRALAGDLRRQVKFENDPEAKAALLVRLADLLELTLGDRAGALAAHLERLEIDPSDVGAMVALERLYEQQGEWQRLIGVLQMRDGVTTDLDEQRDIARRIGAIYEGRLADVENAIVAYNEVLSRFGADRATLEALGRLYEAGEKWEDLLEILEMMYEAEGESRARAELRFRAAELMRTKTHALERAIEYFHEVLAELPEHEGTIAALEEILTAPDGFARVSAARALVPYYRGTGKYGELLTALEVLAATDDPIEKLQALRQAAEVADMGLEDPAQAFELMGRAVVAGVGEDDLRQMLGDYQRLAIAAGKWREYVDQLKSVAPDVMDEDLQIEVLMIIAAVADEQLSELDVSRQYYTKVLEHRPDHRPALDALEHLHERAGDYAALLDVVRRKTEMSSSSSERVELLLRQAAICARHLNDVPAGIDALEQVLLEEERPEAYLELEGLYARAERFHDLAELYQRKLEHGIGSAVDVRHKLGRVHLDRLKDEFSAIDHFRAVLAVDNQHQPTVDALEELMATEEHRGTAAEILEPVFLARMDWPKVAAALDARLSSETDIEIRKELLRRVGQLHEDYLEDLEGALESYARLFREDPTDETVWDTLTRLAKVLDKWERLAQIYADALAEIEVDEPATAKLAALTGKLYDQRVGSPERAAPFYARALRFEPGDEEVFLLLEAAYAKTEQWGDLLELYRERVDLAESDADRVAILHRTAKLQEEKLVAIPEAIDAYRQVLEIDPGDHAATEALDRLLRGAERWEELADHLRFRIDGAADLRERGDLKHRLGLLLKEKLDDVHGAIDVFQEVVEADPTHGATVQVLEGLVLDPEHQARITQILEPLYRDADQWKKLVAVLEAQVQL